MAKIETSKDLIALYTTFRDDFYSPESVLYPSSGADASPARVFDNVTFVDAEDGNDGCIAALRAARYKAIKSDIRDYKPSEAHDLLILQNPVVPASWSTPHLAKGGYVIANNYHGTASQLMRMPDFRLIFGFNVRDGKVSVERNLEGFFEPVANVEEFIKLRPRDAEFEIKMAESFASQGMIDCSPTDSLEKKFRTYLEEMKFAMPSKRVAHHYLFKND